MKKQVFYKDTPVGAVQKIIDDRNKVGECSGVVEIKDGVGAYRVRVRGAINTIPVDVARGIVLGIGDTVILQRSRETNRWIVTQSYATASNPKVQSGSTSGTPAAAAPTNFTATPAPGGVTLTWTPSGPDGSIAYEIERADDTAETNSVIYMVAGTTAFVQTTDVRYFRIRSVGTDYSRSGWVAWISAPPLNPDSTMDVLMIQVFGG